VTDEVDVWCLAVVHSMEVVVTVDWVQGSVVGKLFLGDGRVILQAKDGVDIVFAFDSGQFTPMSESVSHYQGQKDLCSRLTILS
jgi:hypothetical protein